MADFLFYALSIAALGFGVGVIAARSPMLSVLSLLGSFACLAVIYLLAGFQFVAAAQILVYAGAILVLFLFVVMLLNLADLAALRELPRRVLGKRRLAVAGASAGALVLCGLWSARAHPGPAVDPALAAQGIDDVEQIGVQLLSRYALAFEASSMLLLATMVAVIVLAKRERGPRAERSASDKSGGR